MVRLQGFDADFSPSSAKAVRWAGAAAVHRNLGTASGAQIEPADLLLGVLLAHPDEFGEAQVLLQHFGLTARDVLPAGYPVPTAADLAEAAERSGGPDPVPFSSTTLQVLTGLGQASVVHLADLLGALLTGESPLRTSFSAALLSRGVDLDSVTGSYGRFLDALQRPGKQTTGRQLREWLRRENRRAPVDVPRFSSDEIDADRDLIGIRTEAEAFAYLLASRDLRPPLAIGLFGDWGSGKSFLMRSIKQRVDQLRALVPEGGQGGAAVWRNIRQIEFNAWEYVQGNLWAGLLERLFRELGSLVDSAALLTTRRDPVQQERDDQARQVQQLKAVLNEIDSEQKDLEEKLEKANNAVDSARAEARARLEASGPQVALKSVQRALDDFWGPGSRPLAATSADPAAALADAAAAMAEVRAAAGHGRVLLGPYWTNKKHFVLALMGALAVPVAAWVFAALQAPAVVSLLGGAAAFLGTAAAVLRSGARWTEARLAEFGRAVAEVRDQIRQPVEAAEERRREIEAELAELEQRSAAERDKLHQAEARQQAAEQRLVALTAGRILVDFADERSGDYRRRLGLLATVRRDLSSLSDVIRANNDLYAVEPGSAAQPPDAAVPNRIILYIDDLDRCPPAKVLEVLEAVHLLLAFPMFAVVVAVDSHWLSAALKDQLHALRARSPRGAGAPDRPPTPADYLEKIFQLPFRVPALPAAARARMLHGLLAPSLRPRPEPAADNPAEGALRVGPRESGTIEAMLSRSGETLRLETSPLALSPDDLEVIESMAPLLGHTPRRVKRFVNSCQLLLAMPPALSSTVPASGGTAVQPVPDERAIVCFLAAVNEGLPSAAEALFALTESKSPDRLASLTSRGDLDPAEVSRLTAWLDSHQAWGQLSFAQLAVRTDMVRRLRF
ncbi:P-loop NTPase fold protein [Arthrobacter mobilis]|uniref:KAP NTPase domain-containing protein n=1 Tax=Arthrobacter mobilis TaxID=2724944 RepID=A0A7X6K522_9MICC|nr:P-loop NTPase fold protein [Arthrobacter mobilis]NKX53330.1 hypothetical protein [Arthrobacter mobilis]